MDAATFTAKTLRAEDGCLIWMGRKTHDGYGIVSEAGKTLYLHRWAQEHFNGPIPEGCQVDHLCNVASCVEPSHLEPVTLQENMRRLSERTVNCKRGHEFTPENTYIQKGTGRKSCKACRRDAYRRFLNDNPGYHAKWKAKKGGNAA